MMERLLTARELADEDVRLTAREWAEMMAAPVRDRTYRQVTGLGPLIAEWLDYKRLQARSELTVDQYERCLARFALVFPGKTAAEVTTADLMQFLATLPGGSRRKSRAALAGFFQWALIFDYIDRDPMLRAPVIAKPPKDVYEIFTEAERDALEHLPRAEDSALMVLLFGSGIRAGEARGVRLGHLREHDTLWVDGKGRRQRLIPLRPRVVAAVQELAVFGGLNPDDLLWYGTRGGRYPAIKRERPIGYASFHGWWVRCLDRAGVEYRPRNPQAGDPGIHSPHCTRHTYATEYLRRGGKIEMLSRILGHSSVAVTDEAYAHLVTEDLAADAERVWG